MISASEWMAVELQCLKSLHRASCSDSLDFKGQHRIDEALVKQKFQAAGFVLEAESDLLRVKDDDRTHAFFAPEMQGRNTDKFILRFRKPR